MRLFVIAVAVLTMMLLVSTAFAGAPKGVDVDKPKGDGPFPAVVLLHGCGGFQLGNDDWAKQLRKWGYVTAMVDSLSPRGLREICTELVARAKNPEAPIRLLVKDRVPDAYSALDYLRTLRYVDSNRIAVMGWSHGAITTLATLAEARDNGFKAGVAMYPYCNQGQPSVPVQIHIGDQDDWTPASVCQETYGGNKLVDIHIYKGAYHSFDNPNARTYLGHVMGFDWKATGQARDAVRAFLDRALGEGATGSAAR